MARRVAFAITNTDGDGAILFAANEAAARKRANRDMVLDVLDADDIKVSRAPYADAYANSGVVPASVMIEHGWRLECAACGKTFDSDRLHELGLPISGVEGQQHGAVYCSAAAKGRHLVQTARIARERHRFVAGLTEALLRTHPAARVLDGPGTSHAYVTIEGDVAVLQEGSISFTFPGMAHGPAHFVMRRGLAPHQRIGPIAPRVECAFGDVEAFRAWARGEARAA